MTDDEGLRRRRRARVFGLLLTVAGTFVLSVLVAPRDDAPRGPRRAEAAEAACDAERPERADPRRYEAPGRVIRPGVDYHAIVTTSCGPIEIDLLEETAPENVNSFVFLSREGFYDGLTWHRIEAYSVIQAGDPNGRPLDPPDGPGYYVPDELPDRARDYVYGVVGMANEGRPDTGGSQFFIVVHENRPAGYQTVYSIFGVVEKSSYDTLQEIATQDVKLGTDPIEAVEPRVPIYIESIEIVEQ